MADLPLPTNWREAFRHSLWGTLSFAAGFEGVNTLVHGDWTTSAISFLLMGAFLFILVNGIASFRSKWGKVTETTDLVDFEEVNKESKYMPDKILARKNVSDLFVMGNGCSKWTLQVGATSAFNAFRQIRKGGGNIRFMASCPVYLSQLKDDTKRKKAKKNAISLLKLREFAEQSRPAGGSFQIRTYKHVATLRLIIINGAECIVGHYQEDGDGDSIETPLLVFHHTHDNKWGFGGAFRRMFDSEWHRAVAPTDEEWKKMSELGDPLE